MNITFVVIRRCGGGGGYALWAYHVEERHTVEVATYKGTPGRHLVDSCALVYERGVAGGIKAQTGKDIEVNSKIILNEDEVSFFLRGYYADNMDGE